MAMGFRDVLNGMNNNFKARAEEARVEKQRQANEARAAQERRTAEYLAANPPKSIWYHLFGYFSFYIAIMFGLLYICSSSWAKDSDYKYEISKKSFEKAIIEKRQDENSFKYIKEGLEADKKELEFNKALKGISGALGLMSICWCVIYRFKEWR
jgi:hypothetical protein